MNHEYDEPPDGDDLVRVLLVCALGVLALVLISCASGGIQAQLEPARPDMTGVLSFAGRFGLSHGCPVEDGRFALLSAHAVDERPFDGSVPLFGARWSDGYGNSGTLSPITASTVADVAIAMRWDGKPWEHSFPLADKAPQEGDRLYVVGYDYRNKQKAFRPRYTDGPVLFVVADQVVLDATTWKGTSGGCLLNQRGEVVALPMWWPFPLDNHTEVAMAVGVWSSIESIQALFEKAEHEWAMRQAVEDAAEILQQLELTQ